MNDNDAGYLNDPIQARDAVVLKRTPTRRCRHCKSPIVRIPQGALVCSGTCDQPIASDEFTRQVITGIE